MSGALNIEVGGGIGGGGLEQIFQGGRAQFLFHFVVQFGKEKIHGVAGAQRGALLQTGDFAFHDSKDFPESDLARGFLQAVSAAGTAAADEKLAMAEGEEDLFKKFGRDILGLADFGDGVELAGVAGEFDEGAKGIFATF